MSSSEVIVGELAEFSTSFGRPPNEVVCDLESFFLLLQKWQSAQNLVSRETLGEFWTRHILDSLQLLPMIEDKHQLIVDLGSGGGFPAIPLAIALKGTNRKLVMVDSNRRKVSFLRTAIRDLELDARAIDSRIEDVKLEKSEQVDLLTSRATASLDLILSLSLHLVLNSTDALLHKGREYREEIANAHVNYEFDVVPCASLTDPESAILRIANIRRRNQ